MTSVTLLSGFLGSGKTTLVNRILASEPGVRLGVVVNDFGALDIDARLIVGVEGDTVSLANGCVCCSLRDDLMDAIAQLRALEPPVDHVLVECSGIADPRVLARTFMALEKGLLLELDSIVSVVDAAELLSLDPRDLSLARDQLEVSDVVIVNKVDLVTPEQLADVREEVERFAPSACILECQRCEVPLELVLGVGTFDPQKLQDDRPPAHHHYARASYAASEPLSLERLREVATELPASVYRAKGFVYLREKPELRCVLHVVGRRARLSADRPWQAGEERCTQLVFIGRGSIDESELKQHFDACLKPPVKLSAFSRGVDWLRSRLGS